MSTPDRSSVGRYKLRERLGAGGMGTVWRAFDPALQRDVAVKEVLLPEGMDPDARAEAHARTMREAQATARINSTAVVAVHDVLDEEESPWIVMELLTGTSLQQHLDRHGPMPVDRVEEAARSLLGGLKAAHAAGVTHRDIKPANIMLTDDDRTVLTDFGIANVDGTTALTQTGVYIGSPEYMAPERFEGERALPASDLWSLGVTLYSLLEGRSPFKRDSITGIISAVLTSPMPPRLSMPDAAQGTPGTPLRALITALLNRDASARPTPDEALALLKREREAPARGDGLTAAPGTGPQNPVNGPTGGQPAHGAYGPGHHGVSIPHTPASGPQAPHRPGTGGQPPHSLHTPHSNTPGHLGGSGPHTPYPGGPRPPAANSNTLHPLAARTRQQPLSGPQQAQRGPVGPSGEPDTRGPASVIAAAVMLGLNALYLMVLTALFINEILSGSDQYGWGTVLLIGVWGLFSAFAGVGLMTRSRILYGSVVVVQIVVSLLLILTMFSVLIYTPGQLTWYGLVLVFNLVIGGLLLIPPRARAFFGFGADFG